LQFHYWVVDHSSGCSCCWNVSYHYVAGAFLVAVTLVNPEFLCCSCSYLVLSTSLLQLQFHYWVVNPSSGCSCR
jgi:hypothetical protein